MLEFTEIPLLFVPKMMSHHACIIPYVNSRYSGILYELLCSQILCYLIPLKAELNPIYHLLALLGAHHILHVSRLWVNGTVTFKL